MIDASWRERAACRGMAPADGTVEDHPFFPDACSALDPHIEALCRGCPVRSECEEAGHAGAEGGVWGGRMRAWTQRSWRRQHVGERRREAEDLPRGVCARCDEPFTERGVGQLFCSMACSDATRAERRRAAG